MLMLVSLGLLLLLLLSYDYYNCDKYYCYTVLRLLIVYSHCR